MATSTITVKVDLTEFEALIQDIRRLELALEARSDTGLPSAVVAGLVLAGSPRRCVTRRSLLGFGWLASRTHGSP